MFWKKLAFIVPMAFVAMIGLTACDDEGPAEKAGEQIDDAADEAGDAVDDAADDASDAADDAADEAQDSAS